MRLFREEIVVKGIFRSNQDSTHIGTYPQIQTPFICYILYMHQVVAKYIIFVMVHSITFPFG